QHDVLLAAGQLAVHGGELAGHDEGGHDADVAVVAEVADVGQAADLAHDAADRLGHALPRHPPVGRTGLAAGEQQCEDRGGRKRTPDDPEQTLIHGVLPKRMWTRDGRGRSAPSPVTITYEMLGQLLAAPGLFFSTTPSPRRMPFTRLGRGPTGGF